MANYCRNCAQALEPSWRACPNCGTEVEPSTEGGGTKEEGPSGAHGPRLPPDASLSDRVSYAWAQASGPVECPGCHQTTGMAGALCPECGSRYPSPRTGMVGSGIAAFGGLLLLIALIGTGGLLQEDVGGVESVGWLLLVVGIGMTIYSVGRVGPQRQASCCGCSCVIALLVLPAATLALWSAGGPLLAAIALPAWVPLIWLLEAAALTARFAGAWASSCCALQSPVGTSSDVPESAIAPLQVLTGPPGGATPSNVERAGAGCDCSDLAKPISPQRASDPGSGSIFGFQHSRA
jgi:RNA polymerase subunit RPABC4/transcription elongation factor Spt4